MSFGGLGAGRGRGGPFLSVGAGLAVEIARRSREKQILRHRHGVEMATRLTWYPLPSGDFVLALFVILQLSFLVKYWGQLR